MMDIRTYLSQGKPLLFDGAMGTYFAAHPGRAEERCERANLTRPEEILRIHRAYLQAGCRAISARPDGSPNWSNVGPTFYRGLHARRLDETKLCLTPDKP